MVLFLVLANGARADGIYWTASWSRSPSEIDADSPGTGMIILTQDTTAVTHQDTSYLTATNIQTYSTATAANPDVFINKPFELDLSLTDLASGTSHIFAFTGVFNGTLTATQSLVQPTYTSPTTLSYLVGSNFYTVSVGPYAWPDVPGSPHTGAISFVTEVAVQGGPGIPKVPEPGTFLLSGIGLSLGALCWACKRRVPSAMPVGC
jgi:hypothetical protein